MLTNKSQLKKYVELQFDEKLRELKTKYTEDRIQSKKDDILIEVSYEISQLSNLTKQIEVLFARIENNLNLKLNLEDYQYKRFKKKFEGFGVNYIIQELSSNYNLDGNSDLIKINKKFKNDNEKLMQELNSVKANLYTMSFKKGIEFLKEIGISVPENETIETSVLAPIDVEFIKNTFRGEK